MGNTNNKRRRQNGNGSDNCSTHTAHNWLQAALDNNWLTRLQRTIVEANANMPETRSLALRLLLSRLRSLAVPLSHVSLDGCLPGCACMCAWESAKAALYAI